MSSQKNKRISYDKLRSIFPRASQSFLELNSKDVAPFPHSTITECNTGSALEQAGEGETAGSKSPACRFKIVFRVRSCHPCDWDNYRCKELQDLLVKAGVLPDDKWSILQGEVIPEKVRTHEEEGTLIEVYQCTDAPS